MIERRNVLEIMIGIHANCFARSQTRINLLFTMSEIPHAHPKGRNMRSDVSRTVSTRRLRRSSIPSGGARRDRTDDLMLAKHALSQLSYGPVPEDECRLPVRRIRSIKVVGLGRLELPTSRLSSARSNQLSYKPQRPISNKGLWGLAGTTRKCNVDRTARPGACSSAKKEKRRRRCPANAAQQS